MQRSYRINDSWKKLQRHRPAGYRWSAADEPQEEFRRWRSSTLHLDRFANPDASHKIILLHGVGTNGRQLQLIAGAPLARAGFEVVAIDMPYYGMTDNREKRIRWQDWVEIGAEQVRLETQRDGKPIVLFGLSAGGMLAYQVAALTRAVKGVMGMCFIDTRSEVARRNASARPTFDEISFKLLHLLPASLLGSIFVPMKQLVQMQALVNSAEALNVLLADTASAGASVSLEFVKSLICYEPAIPFEQFDICPILLLQPGADRWTPFSVTQPFWQRVAAQKSLVTLEHAGHFPLEQPGLEQMREAMVGFVDSL